MSKPFSRSTWTDVWLTNTPVITLRRPGNSLPRPAEAFFTFEDMQAILAKANDGKNDFPAFVALSYRWLAPGHPDREGHHLRIVSMFFSNKKLLGTFVYPQDITKIATKKSTCKSGRQLDLPAKLALCITCTISSIVMPMRF